MPTDVERVRPMGVCLCVLRGYLSNIHHAPGNASTNGKIGVNSINGRTLRRFAAAA
jgi:hypothetical protein